MGATKRFHKEHFRREKEPTNHKLWNMLVERARRTFTPYPSLPASRWIHAEYVKQGGAFEEKQVNAHESNRRKKDTQTRESKKRQEEDKKEGREIAKKHKAEREAATK